MDEPNIVRSFSQFVGEAEDGQLQTDLTSEMQDLVAALSNAAAERGGKPKGKLTLTVEMKLVDGAFEVLTDIKIAAPKVARARSIFFATPDNNLTREHPRQQRLPLHDVAVAQREVR